MFYQHLQPLSLKKFIAAFRVKINESFTSNEQSFYGTVALNTEDSAMSHVSVIDRDGNGVSITSSIGHV